MASHKSRDGFLWRERVIIVVADVAPWLVLSSCWWRPQPAAPPWISALTGRWRCCAASGVSLLRSLHGLPASDAPSGHAWPLLGFSHAPPAGITASARRAPRASPGPSRPSPSFQWLELRYGTLAACGRVAHGGREAWRRGSADGFCAREGGNTLRFATPIPPLYSAQTASFPTPPPPPPMTAGAPPRRRRKALGPGSASALAASLARLGGLSYLNRVGPGGVARAAGRPVVPEPRRRRASQGEQALFWLLPASVEFIKKPSMWLLWSLRLLCFFVIIYIIAIIVLIGVVFKETRWSRSHLGGQACCNR
jgi:hypothetical protein